MLPVTLGLDLEGRPVIADLAKMPHLLIAGATGTGKSVGINAIITSLIYQYQHKEDLRFLMIDPKMVELSMYKDLPHLRHPVVTNNREAARVLKWAVAEMERRYALLEANGARNIIDFNRKVLDGKPLRNPVPKKVTLSDIAAEAPDTPPPTPEEPYTQGKLPLIVLVVDELADLMMTVQAEIEAPLARLAQKARAVGLHLIVATQRPSVNVITGLIKANFPSRIAFRVAQKVDSRTILDQNGAEALLGKGDMLFLEPGKSEPMRLQGAYISTEESERLMERYREWRDEQKRRGVTEAAETNILDEVPDTEGGEGGRRGRTGSLGAGPVVQGSGLRLRAEPGRLHLVAAAEARHRLRPRGAAHGSAGGGRDPGPAERQQAAGRPNRNRPGGRVLQLRRSTASRSTSRCPWSPAMYRHDLLLAAEARLRPLWPLRKRTCR